MDGEAIKGTTDLPWPVEAAWMEPLSRPEYWGRPGLVMFFSLECAGCVSRGIPFMKDLFRDHGERLRFVAVHTSLGRTVYPRGQVVPQLERFSRDFARLPFPVTLDLEGRIAEAWGAEGTPHWLVFDAGGRLLRSIFGSQENARTRIEYLVDELDPPPA